MRPRLADLGFTELVARATQRDPAAWAALVERLERVVWKTVNVTTTDPEVRKDAAAATWLRLAENLASIRDPERLPGWVVTTARREVIAHFRKTRFRYDGAVDDREPPATDMRPDEHVEEFELRQVLRAAFRKLSAECQELLSLFLLVDPPLSYAEVEVVLNRPHGSLGPTRARCLERLRQMPELRGFVDGGAGKR